MDGTLSLITNTLGYSDPGLPAPGNDPKKKSADWTANITVTAKNIASTPYTVAPASSLTLFDGSRSISADGTTQWTLSLSTLSPVRYRFTATGGTAPALRTNRGLTLSSDSVVVVVNSNQTVTMTTSASAFSAAQVGDTLFIPGVSTGDTAGPFNPLNEGIWNVLSVAGDGSSVQLSRLGTFSGLSQTVSVTSNSQVIAFSAAGVQVGDGVFVSAGFAASVQLGYTVVAVTPTWFEVQVTAQLPVSAVATPGATGIQFYSAAKRYVELWADQECVLRLNGDTGDFNKISPWQAGDVLQAGHFAKAGIAWTGIVVNKSSVPMNIQLIVAE